MKFVRWLGAFGQSSESVAESASWELSQTERQVAAEPLWHGKSFISHAKIGIVIANPEATFARGWLYDSYTVTDNHGINLATSRRKDEFKNMDKFLKVFSKQDRDWGHAEAAFNCPTYNAVVVKKGASASAKSKAKRLALEFNLPMRML